MPTPLNHGMEATICKLQGATTNHLTCQAGGFCVMFQPSRTRVTWKRPSIWRIHWDVTLDRKISKVKLRQHKFYRNISNKDVMNNAKMSKEPWHIVMKSIKSQQAGETFPLFANNSLKTHLLSVKLISVLATAKTIQHYTSIPFSVFYLRSLRQHFSNGLRRRPNQFEKKMR